MKLALSLAALLAAALWVADFSYPLELPHDRQQYSRVVLDRDGQPLRAFPDATGIWRHEVKLEAVSPRYIEALLAYEDRYFYWHMGVNPVSLFRAAWQWFTNGRIISGGSTITMQVARILHPHSRSVAGKIAQILRAFQLEWHLSKDEILTVYLNYAPFGGNFEGVEAASRQYLRKSSAELRDAEAALLAVLPQSPTRFRPDRHPDIALGARDKVIDRLVKFGVWSELEAAAAKQEGIISWPPLTPFVGPLITRRLVNTYAEPVVSSYIDADLQQRIASIAALHANQWGSETNAAVIVVHNPTGEVISYIGSAKFGDPDSAGFVDMVSATRSPGSTLKPVLFALALDDQLIHSESLFIDAPRIEADYQPENFQAGYHGPIAIAHALRLSLNIPFVQLIEAYGPQRLVDKLAHVQTPLRVVNDDANPAIILGGAGFSLEQLAAVYRGFARQGEVTPLRFSPQQSPQLSRRLMSAEAAYIGFQVMAAQTLPTRAGHREQSPAHPIAWKSGTSWGHRDAWAVGVSSEYTVAVWLGRADSQPVVDLTGASAAGPLMTDVFQQLPGAPQPLARPDTVLTRTICWPDGRMLEAVSHCPIRHRALSIGGLTPRTLDPQRAGDFFIAEREVLVNSDATKRLPGSCADKARRVNYPIWPDSAAGFSLVQASSTLPPIAPDCTELNITAQISESNYPLRVEGLTPGQVLRFVDQQAIRINLAAASAAEPIDWILNGVLMQSNGQQLQLPFIASQRGNYRLLVIDALGRHRTIDFTIQ